MPSFDSSDLKLSQPTYLRLQELLKRQSSSQLNEDERRELDLLVEVDHMLSTLRAKAQKLVNGTSPPRVNLGRTTRNGLPVVVVPAGTPAIDPDLVRSILQEEGF
jgi:hypothetical protein